MNYLLDTHCLIWAIADSKKLSKRIMNLISDANRQILVSTISFWEVSLKMSIGKMEIAGFQPEDLPEICTKIGFDILELSAADSSSYHQLKASYHKDPFDRMLIWQAIRNDYTLISVDEQIVKYHSEGLKIFVR
jgi:PIN domain nuclease of toxin-antitoxin system